MSEQQTSEVAQASASGEGAAAAPAAGDELDEVLEEFSAFREASSALEKTLRQQIAERDTAIASLTAAAAAKSDRDAKEENEVGGEVNRHQFQELSKRNVQLENDLLRLERQLREDEFARTKLLEERDAAVLARTAAEEERVTAADELLELRRRTDALRKEKSVTEDWLASVLARLQQLLPRSSK